MKALALFGEKRQALGKRSTKDLRNEGKVPCVLYGDKKEPVHFFIYSSDFTDLVYTPNTLIAKLSIDGEIQKAILQDIQYHPVNEIILHADFLAIQDDKPVTLEIPVKVVGNSPGVRAGGKLVKKIKKLRVKGFLNKIPDFIDVNIDALEMGKSIKVEEMSLDGIAFLDSPVNAIVSVVQTRSSKQEAATAGK
jgi:large subunit ribosomal protein L25